ncbi:uncharacterized protein LOC144584844 [Pogona vitticeps]
MATGTFLLLAMLALTLSTVPSLMGEADSSKSSCKPQIRYGRPSLDTLPWPGYWVPLMIILAGFCGLTWCILYMTYNISQRGEEESTQLPSKAEEPAVPLANQECGTEITPDVPTTCAAPQALACIQPKSSSCKPAYNPIQQAYAHQLASMEEQLESFLHEVRGRRCALGDILLDEQHLANLKRDSNKLRITVYEIADSEGAGQVQERRSARKLK